MFGKNCPYPIALGKENVYFMLDNIYIQRKYFPKKMKNLDFENAYYLFHDFEINNNKLNSKNKISKNAVKFKFKKHKNIYPK